MQLFICCHIFLHSQGTVSISSSCAVAGDVSKRCCSRHRASLVHRGFLPSRVTQCGSREEREGEEEGGGESGAVAARTDEGGGTWRSVSVCLHHSIHTLVLSRTKRYF